jgi:hypothetical protein
VLLRIFQFMDLKWELTLLAGKIVYQAR